MYCFCRFIAVGIAEWNQMEFKEWFFTHPGQVILLVVRNTYKNSNNLIIILLSFGKKMSLITRFCTEDI